MKIILTFTINNLNDYYNAPGVPGNIKTLKIWEQLITEHLNYFVI